MPQESTHVTTALSPSRLLRMGEDLIQLAGLMAKLEQRSLPYRVDGGLVMSTRVAAGDQSQVFTVHGTLDVVVPAISQDRLGPTQRADNPFGVNGEVDHG